MNAKLTPPCQPKFFKKIWQASRKKDWQDRFLIFFKLFFGFATLTVVFSAWIIDLHNLHFDPKKPNYYDLNGDIFSIHYFSFFTIQTVSFCALFWIGAGFCHNKEGKWGIFKWQYGLAVAVYITITFIIFNSLLWPTFLVAQPGPFDWFQTCWEHIVVPIAFITYYVFLLRGVSQANIKLFFCRQVWWYFIYPLAWLTYALVNGYLKAYRNYITTLFPHDHVIYFDYFFLNLSGHKWGLPGYFWFVTAFVVVAAIIISSSCLYLFLRQKVYHARLRSQDQTNQ